MNHIEEYGRVWERFEQLAASGELGRQRAYEEGGLTFLTSLFRCATNCEPPMVTSAEQFSQLIVELRTNYRQWNQYLMSVATADEGGGAASRDQLLGEFTSECIWRVLVEAAQSLRTLPPKA